VGIRIRSASDEPSSLVYRGNKLRISTSWQELRVQRGDEKVEMAFAVEGCPILVSRAWVE
jgi:hypothetical protein